MTRHPILTTAAIATAVALAAIAGGAKAVGALVVVGCLIWLAIRALLDAADDHLDPIIDAQCSTPRDALRGEQ